MQELIDSLMQYFAEHGKDAETPETAEGTIAMWQRGEGELPAELVNGSDLWKPVVEAYFAAKGQPVPETLSQPIVEVEKTPEAGATG